MSFWNTNHKITMEGYWIGIILGAGVTSMVINIIAFVIWIS